MAISQARQTAATDGKTAVRETIEKYLTAVKTWNEAAFRETFHPAANISHYYVKGDAIKTITLDEFVASIESLHRKFDNAEEVAEEIEVRERTFSHQASPGMLVCARAVPDGQAHQLLGGLFHVRVGTELFQDLGRLGTWPYASDDISRHDRLRVRRMTGGYVLVSP